MLEIECKPTVKAKPVIGVPQALNHFDTAPLVLGYLDCLGVGVRLSTPTNKRTIEAALKYAHTDSCFPVKVFHGHVAELNNDPEVDFIIAPNALRMGRRPPGEEGSKDQRFVCPLAASSPYIVKAAFRLDGKMLDPVFDFSQGDGEVISSLTAIAQKSLGYSAKQGKRAALQGLTAQRDFEKNMREAGQNILDELADDPDRLGVIVLSRAYNSQDDGANFGMMGELQRLGVTPIPLDFLPLDEVDVKAITDRPYWNYERKLLAAAKLVTDHTQLFGLFLSNFGCGPNSFIEKILRDIMGRKPLGEIELDEHAAEAGYITRLEAFVDTIRSYRRSGLHLVVDPAKYKRKVSVSARRGEVLYTPRMADHVDVVCGAMQAFGVNGKVLPESDERSMALSRDVTSGKECLPFRDSLGVFLRMAEDGELPPSARALMAGSYGPCRLGKYAQEQERILQQRLQEQGISVEILTTSSHDSYADLGLGQKFEYLAWQGIVAVDLLQRMLWMTRPYEKRSYQGQADIIYQRSLDKLVQVVECRQDLVSILREAMETFLELRDPSLPRRPLVGINGEIYLRANRFCNKDLVLECESNGLEVEVAPMGEWFKYTTFRNVEDAWSNREFRRLIKSFIRKAVLDYSESRLASAVKEMIHEREPSTAELLRESSVYIPSRNGTEAVLSVGSGLRNMRDPRFAGVISVMPHGCMPGGIVAAMGEQISKEHGNKPWISLTYDGFPDKVNSERIADFAQQVRHGRG